MSLMKGLLPGYDFYEVKVLYCSYLQTVRKRWSSEALRAVCSAVLVPKTSRWSEYGLHNGTPNSAWRREVFEDPVKSRHSLTIVWTSCLPF